MFWNTANNYNPLFSHMYISPTYFYSSYPSQLYESPTLFALSLKSIKSIPSKNTQLYNQHHQYDKTANEKYQPQVLSSINKYCYILRKYAKTITNKRLTHILNQLTYSMTHLNTIDQQQQQQQQQSPILIDVLNALYGIPSTILTSVLQHKFFSILRISFINILRRWRYLAFLPNGESLTFRSIIKLLNIITNNISLIPSWLSDSILLKTTAHCLTDIATSGKFLDSQNKYSFKYFTLLIDAYILYQQHLNQQNYPNKDIFVRLLDPMLQCLTSNHFITAFTDLQIDSKSMTTIQKFFLLKSSAFITSYNGSHLEQTVDTLLTTMLPHYLKILDQFVPLAHKWNRSVTRSIQHLLETINHGANQFSINAKLISNHLSLIDHVLTIVNEPMIYNNLHETLSNLQTNLMNTAINFLLNMINEPIILAHIKQSRVASIFVRLTSCKYEALVLNVYNILAYTTHEDDIKTMHNVDKLLSAIIQSLKTSLYRKSKKEKEVVQVLETLKGLVQHDRIKDEIIKQDMLPFLLELTNEITGNALVLLYEILWSLTFFEDVGRILRADPDFLEKIQTISKDIDNVPLKMAVDGLVWKLIQEPEFLEKVTKRNEEEEEEQQQNAATNDVITTRELTIGIDGTEQVVTTTEIGSIVSDKRSYQYDIMISYCHVDKVLARKIHKFLLKQGFKIWIDLDNMYGPAMSAMADAVENSEFVIMCMSDSYKQSTYCQAEAEYAFNCKRRLVPLIMIPGYKPDGWLGFMIGSRIYVDFGRYDFDKACRKLMTEINLQRKQNITTTVVEPLDHSTPDDMSSSDSKHTRNKKKLSSSKHIPKEPPASETLPLSIAEATYIKRSLAQKHIDQWTTSDVSNFLLANHLDKIMPLFNEMNGRTLIQLYNICTTQKLDGYSILKDELKSLHRTQISMNIYSRFLTIVEDAMKSSEILTQSTELPSMDYLPMAIPSFPFIPASDLDTSYDFFITTDVSPFDTLKMVEQYSSQLQYLDSVRHRTKTMFSM